MKKYLKSFAILFASVLLGTTGVNAAQVCSNGEVEHTNYYLFLDVNNQDYISNGVSNGNGLLQYRTAAEKTNNINGNRIISNGEIAVTNGSDSTKPGNSRSWTVTNYWKKYYNAINNADSSLIYNENDSTSYIIHNNWFSYAAGDTSYSNGVKKYGDFGSSTLSNYIRSNYNSLGNSDLVKNGTALPTTSFIDVNSASMQTTTDNFFFKVYREYRNEDVVAGSNLNGGLNNNKIWAPAVYYVTYCKKSKNVTPSKNTITYVGNGENVTNVPNKNTFNSGECTEISTIKPKRSGYTFLGWSTSANATSAMSKYSAGNEYCEGDITLYAIWKKNDTTPVKNNHKLIYDGNAKNVTNVPNTVIFVEGDTLIIDNSIPVRPGYVFLGWNENKDAKKADPDYAANSKHIGKDKDITLYAIWKEKDTNEYSITYLPNTTDVVSNMPGVQVIEIGKNATISTTVPVRAGYKFLGWSTQEGATTPDESYKGGSTYSDGKDLVLYAVWEKDNSGSSNLPENPKTGITDYIVPFSSVAIASGAGIGILRKKKSFLQF